MRTLLRSRPVPATTLCAAFGLLGLLSFGGCGGAPSADAPSAAHPGKTGESSAAIPTASIGSPANRPEGAPDQSEPSTNQTAPDSQAVPKKDSPEWELGQMLVLQAERPTPDVPLKDNLARAKERNHKIIEMANDLIARTHKEKSLEPVFNKAVQMLCNSRLDLATGGSADEAKALQADAEAFYRRDPGSVAAEEAGWHLARLAHTYARQAKNDRRKIQEFAIAARLFATRFPKSEAKALPLLAAAAKTCELYHFDGEAINCFAMLQEKFPKTPQAEQATAILRRLELKGKKVKLFGETSDGRFLKPGQLVGKPVLVVFWSSDSDVFQEMLPQLQKATRPYERAGLMILGVCLDEEKAPMDAFIEKNGLTWPQLFYADADKRHWDHPLAQYYGVHDIPSLWLVDQEGVAVDTHVTADSLDSQLRYLIAVEGSNQRN